MGELADRIRIPPGLIVTSLALWICSYAAATTFIALGPERLDVLHIRRGILTMLGAGAYFVLVLKLQEPEFESLPRRLVAILFAALSMGVALWALRFASDAAYAGDPLDPVADAQWVLVWLSVFLMWIAAGTAVWDSAAVPEGRAEAVVRKLWSRIAPDARDRAQADSLAWCRSRAEGLDGWAITLNVELWSEACSFKARIECNRPSELCLPEFVGGGSATALLYFLTRLLRPSRVLETGVAAGWSTYAILAAMEKNGKGTVFSSDLPYVGRLGARGIIGTVVPSELKHRWKLWIDGDRCNLPRILADARSFDIAHYDSDKTYSGREFFVSCFPPNQIAETVWLFDDIEDNLHFRDFVARYGLVGHVFSYDDKFIGVAAAPSRYSFICRPSGST